MKLTSPFSVTSQMTKCGRQWGRMVWWVFILSLLVFHGGLRPSISNVMSGCGPLLTTSHGSSSRWRGVLLFKFHPQRSNPMREMTKARTHTGRGAILLSFCHECDLSISIGFNSCRQSEWRVIIQSCHAHATPSNLCLGLYVWYFPLSLTTSFSYFAHYHLSVPVAFNCPHSPSSCVHL